MLCTLIWSQQKHEKRELEQVEKMNLIPERPHLIFAIPYYHKSIQRTWIVPRVHQLIIDTNISKLSVSSLNGESQNTAEIIFDDNALGI